MANSQGIISPAYTVLRSKKEFAPLFYDAYFHTDEFINHVLSKSVEGIRDGRQISYEAFKWLGIPSCSLAEQTKISNIFSLLQSRIEKQQALVNYLKKYKRGVICKIFDEITRSTSSMIELGNMCHSISSGKTTKVMENGVYPLLGSTGQIGYTDTIEYDEDVILVARVGANAGVVNFHSGPCGVTDNTLVIRVDKYKFQSQYIMYFLKYYDPHRLIFGSGQPLVTGGQLKKIKVPFLDSGRQKYIIELLSLLEKRQTSEQHILDALTSIKTGMLQQLFI